MKPAMAFIDWSDSEEMLGLLVEFVADEKHLAEDPERLRFLASLKEQLEELQNRFAFLPPGDGADALRIICRGIDPAFARDPVVEHVHDCIEELERVDAGAAGLSAPPDRQDG